MYDQHQHRSAKPKPPEVRDPAARVMLMFVLILLIPLVVMDGYVFTVVHHMVDGLQQIGRAFKSAGGN